MPSELRRGEVTTASAGHDDVSRSWVDGLLASGREHDRCVAQLHALLVRVARHETSRRAGVLHLRGPEVDDIAQQAADDALMAIKAKVADFRGESRFTTWAYRFVMFEVSTKIGRHSWRHRPIDRLGAIARPPGCRTAPGGGGTGSVRRASPGD